MAAGLGGGPFVMRAARQAFSVREVYWLAVGAPLSAARSEKPILACAALEIMSKYFWSSPITIEGLHWGVQLKVWRSVPRCRLTTLASSRRTSTRWSWMTLRSASSAMMLVMPKLLPVTTNRLPDWMAMSAMAGLPMMISDGGRGSRNSWDWSYLTIRSSAARAAGMATASACAAVRAKSSAKRLARGFLRAAIMAAVPLRQIRMRQFVW